MDNISAEELNNNLLSSDLFKCKVCLQILRPPIMYVVRGGNCCGSCMASKDCQQNYELEAVLSKLIVPCKFHIHGCSFKGNVKHVDNHETTCNFHSLICPYTYSGECTEEYVTNIIEHFEEVHTHSIISTETDTIKLCFHIATLHNRLNLLVFQNEKFLVHIIQDLDDDKVYYLAYYIGNAEKANKFLCTIEYAAGNTKMEMIVTVLHESTFTLDYDKSNAASFNMEFLREMFKDNVYVSIKMSKKDTPTYSESYERLLNCFECPVCNAIMRPPIFQCLSGHSICNKCRTKVSHCPTCRSNYGSTRNYTLENISSTIKYPCSYQEWGCRDYFSVTEIAQHESDCCLKPFDCPFSGYMACKWNGALNSMVNHIQTNHPEHISLGNIYSETIPYSDDKQFFNIKILSAYGKVFRLCHQRHIGTQNGYWSVQLIGAKGEAKGYTCQIALVDQRNSERKLIRTDVCQDMTTQDFMFNQCIMLPLSVVYWFCHKGHLQFYYKIIKQAAI